MLEHFSGAKDTPLREFFHQCAGWEYKELFTANRRVLSTAAWLTPRPATIYSGLVGAPLAVRARVGHAASVRTRVLAPPGVSLGADADIQTGLEPGGPPVLLRTPFVGLQTRMLGLQIPPAV